MRVPVADRYDYRAMNAGGQFKPNINGKVTESEWYEERSHQHVWPTEVNRLNLRSAK